jgi:hypothetical protein
MGGDTPTRDPAYDHSQRSGATRADAEAAVGHSATLTLTGEIVRAGESNEGAWVMFEVDERWGLPPGTRLGMDLECFEVGALRGDQDG